MTVPLVLVWFRGGLDFFGFLLTIKSSRLTKGAGGMYEVFPSMIQFEFVDLQNLGSELSGREESNDSVFMS